MKIQHMLNAQEEQLWNAKDEYAKTLAPAFCKFFKQGYTHFDINYDGSDGKGDLDKFEFNAHKGEARVDQETFLDLPEADLIFDYAHLFLPPNWKDGGNALGSYGTITFKLSTKGCTVSVAHIWRREIYDPSYENSGYVYYDTTK